MESEGRSLYYPEDSSEMYEEYYEDQVRNGLSVYQGKPVMTGIETGSVFYGFLKVLSLCLREEL